MKLRYREILAVLIGPLALFGARTARAAEVRMSVVLYGFGGLRGDLVLESGDATASDVPALAAAIDRFLAGG